MDETTDDKDMPMTPQALSSGAEVTREPQTIIYDPQPTSTTVDGQLTQQFDDTATAEDNDDVPVVFRQ